MSTLQAQLDWKQIIQHHDEKIHIYKEKLKIHNLAKSLAELSLSKIEEDVCVGCDGSGKVRDHKIQGQKVLITCCVCKGTGKNCG